LYHKLSEILKCWNKTSHFSTGLYSVNFNIDVEKLKPAKKYNKLHRKDKRKIIEYEEVCLNCIDTTNDKIINLFTLAEKKP